MSPSTDWIRLGPEPVLPRLHLLCFPHAGGSAAGCLNWATAAPPGMRITAVQPPGRDSRVAEPPLRSAQAVAEALGPALADRDDTVPWAFFGHSLGALLAFETAHWLLQRGIPGPRILVVASAPAPHLPRSSPPLHHLPGPDLLKALEHLGGLPPPWQTTHDWQDCGYHASARTWRSTTPTSPASVPRSHARSPRSPPPRTAWCRYRRSPSGTATPPATGACGSRRAITSSSTPTPPPSWQPHCRRKRDDHDRPRPAHHSAPAMRGSGPPTARIPRSLAGLRCLAGVSGAPSRTSRAHLLRGPPQRCPPRPAPP
ncbi:thioesterase domain-containing protein [Streptomyces noursei]|uniref:thioesterase II family protein n=1 Tax=Streptomyces noursei TaxID=1971 RepID=UPI000996F383